MEEDVFDIEEYLASSSSSSSSSDDAINEEAVEFRQPRARVCDFIVTITGYSDLDFKRHFRLRRNTATDLIDMYANYLAQREEPHFGGRKVVGSDKEIYMFLWYMANTLTFRQLGNLFDTANSTAWVVIDRVSSWLFSIGHFYVTWPTQEEIPEISREFYDKQKIEHIIGAIDCTHITIKAPRAEIKADYFDRKKNYSVSIQAVCDSKMKFLDLYIGEPGSLHDSRVFRRSDLYLKVLENENRMFPRNTFLIGDSAYVLKKWLIVPFKNYGNLTQTQVDFNYLHSSTRVVVEHAFIYLKGRFRRLLHFTEQTDIGSLIKIISCACILHNICLIQNDLYDVTLPENQNLDEYFNEVIEDENNNVEGEERRQELINELLENGVL